MLSGVSGINMNYSAYLYNPSQNRAAQSAQQAQQARAAQSAAQPAAVMGMRRVSDINTPVEPVRPVTAVDPNSATAIELSMPLLQGAADPAEMAVRMRIQYPGQEGEANAQAQQEIQPAEEAKSAQEVYEEGQCQTCAERKYQDGSDDMGVSFQTPTKLSPDQAATAVRGHEMEHVVREQAKAQREDRKVVSQSVTLHTDICPECGRVYISGGVTNTTTAAKQESQSEPQQQGQQNQERVPFAAVA